MIDQIEWFGHASFRIQGTPLIYIDPWRIPRANSAPADVILITHDHYDHCSLPDIEKLRSTKTVIISNRSVADLIDGVTTLRPWQVINIGRACIKAVPAYNSHHPLQFDGLGFVISLNHFDIYYAGDTDLIVDMDRIAPDIAILPIGGRQTMNPSMAVEAVRHLHPRWTIPSHWGSPAEGGTIADLRQFEDEARTLTEVRTLERVR